MVARLPGDALNICARDTLITKKPKSKSWFCQIRDICLTYNLPHPLRLLDFPPSKDNMKKLTTARVLSYWETKLRGEASLLPSLQNFKPEFMSLKTPHLIWRTVGSNPYEVSKAIQQVCFLSGRYRSSCTWRDILQKTGKGFALIEIETIEHILISCNAFTETKKKLYKLWLSTKIPIVYELVLTALSSDKSYLLSVLPSVVRAAQGHSCEIYKELFYLTRTWCFAIHRQRMRKLGRWNFQ